MMRLLKTVAVMAIASVALVAADVAEEEDVLVLTDDNFEEVVTSHEILLVEFYAPWCGHCKSLAPEYAKAAGILKARDPPIRIAKMDATEHKSAPEVYGVQGFPTLKFFKGDSDKEKVVDYDGGRTADDITKWLIKKSGPSVTIVESEAELTKLKESNDVVVYAYLDAADGDNRKVLEEVADADDANLYVATVDAALASAAGKTVPSITLFKNFDEGQNEFDGEFTVDAIAEFVKANSKPLVMTFSQDKASQIFGGDIDVHLLMFADESADYHPKLVEDAKKAANEHKGKLLHIIIPLSEDRILEYFGFKEADLPAVMLVNMGAGMKKFAYDHSGKDLEPHLGASFGDDLLAFEKKYFDGALTPSLKSAEPTDDSAEAVKVIVGKDFQERVVNNEKDVLLEFYAPWCGHCKSLAPKYDELAEKFADVENIMIAKMDATENEVDHPGVDVQGFPTLIFFPAKDKANPVAYEGDRDVKGFTEFLKKHAMSFELDGETHGKDHDEL